MKKIKNNGTISHTWGGQEILAGDYYEIQPQESVTWANDSQLLVDIANNIAVVSDGSKDFTDVNEAINFLKNDTPSEVIITNETTIEYTSRYSLMGDAVMYSCPKNQTTIIDLKLDNKDAPSAILQNEAYIYKYLKGGNIFGENIVLGDYAKFQVVDKDGLLVAMGQLTQQQFDALKVDGAIVLKEYIYKRYLHPTDAVTNTIMAETPGKIPVGAYLRCRYTAVDSGETRNIIINYDIQNKD